MTEKDTRSNEDVYIRNTKDLSFFVTETEPAATTKKKTAKKGKGEKTGK